MKPRLIKCFLGPLWTDAPTPGVKCRDLVKVYRLAETDEYVCKLDGAPGADYFTNDKADALATADHMAHNAKGTH